MGNPFGGGGLERNGLAAGHGESEQKNDNLARYSDWQMFAADANIKFIPIEPEPPKP